MESREQDRFVPLFLESPIRQLNQPHTVERLVKMGDHILEHLGVKNAEVNPAAPLENRGGDLAIGLAHRWIDLEGASRQSAQVAWAGDLVLLQPSTQKSSVGAVPPHCTQCVLHEVVFRISFVTKHDGNQVPNARIELAKLTIMCLARGQTILISQILVPSQAVEKVEAVFDLDVDLVVAEAPEVVVDRLVRVLLRIALNLAALRIWSLRLLLLQGGRILWERPLDDGTFRLRRLATRLATDLGSMVVLKRSNRRTANAVIAP